MYVFTLHMRAHKYVGVNIVKFYFICIYCALLFPTYSCFRGLASVALCPVYVRVCTIMCACACILVVNVFEKNLYNTIYLNI